MRPLQAPALACRAWLGDAAEVPSRVATLSSKMSAGTAAWRQRAGGA